MKSITPQMFSMQRTCNAHSKPVMNKILYIRLSSLASCRYWPGLLWSNQTWRFLLSPPWPSKLPPPRLLTAPLRWPGRPQTAPEETKRTKKGVEFKSLLNMSNVTKIHLRSENGLHRIKILYDKFSHIISFLFFFFLQLMAILVTWKGSALLVTNIK